MTITNIKPIEADGRHWVTINMDGCEKRYGPYADVIAAEAVATRLLPLVPRVETGV